MSDKLKTYYTANISKQNRDRLHEVKETGETLDDALGRILEERTAKNVDVDDMSHVKYHLAEIQKHLDKIRGDRANLEYHPDNFIMPTPEDFRKMREMCELSQSNVGPQVGIDPRRLSDYELGKQTPGLKEAYELILFYQEHWPGEYNE